VPRLLPTLDNGKTISKSLSLAPTSIKLPNLPPLMASLDPSTLVPVLSTHHLDTWESRHSPSRSHTIHLFAPPPVTPRPRLIYNKVSRPCLTQTSVSSSWLISCTRMATMASSLARTTHRLGTALTPPTTDSTTVKATTTRSVIHTHMLRMERPSMDRPTHAARVVTLMNQDADCFTLSVMQPPSMLAVKTVPQTRTACPTSTAQPTTTDTALRSPGSQRNPVTPLKRTGNGTSMTRLAPPRRETSCLRVISFLMV